MYGPGNDISGAACANTGPVATGSVGTEAGRTGQAIGVPTPGEAAPGGAVTPTEGLTTRSDILLMATENPTGGNASVAITIPSKARKFLRGLFTDAREGIRDDLSGFPDRVRNAAALRREEAVYNALLSALDNGSVVVSEDMRCVLCDLAMAVDRMNEYERVVAEHAALLGLRQQINAGAGR